MSHDHIRYIARITIEAETPLSIGSDSVLFDQDAPVQRDWNGLPIIPGTALAGFLRASLALREKPSLDTAIFGDEAGKLRKEGEETQGSKIIISDGYLLDRTMTVHQQIVLDPDPCFLDRYLHLPVRQHVAIEHTGAAKDSALFDQEIVYKGSRFKFEIALEVSNKCDDDWETILQAFQDNNFYLGAGQFNNFGELKCISIESTCFDLSKEKELEAYLKLTVDLNESLGNGSEYSVATKNNHYPSEEITFDGRNSFFHFGSGYGDHEVNNTNYSELVVEWSKNDQPTFNEYYVIPGTSIKGALAHRTAYYYNLRNNKTVESAIKSFEQNLEKKWNKKYALSQFELADNIESLDKQKLGLEKIIRELEEEKLKYDDLFSADVGESNEAVKELFGHAKNSDKAANSGAAGTIIIKDVYLPKASARTTVFNHNKIDRFTGGTVDTALFNERVLYIPQFTLVIKSEKESIKNDHFQAALSDLKNGLLPIGGLVNKGHGLLNEIKANGN